MTRMIRWTFAAALDACCVLPATFAAGQTAAGEAVFRPAESRTSVEPVAYRRGWGGPRYYGSYYRRPYTVGRPYYGNYARPRFYNGYYGGYYGSRYYSRPYYGRGYYGYGSPYYGYTYGRPAFRYGVGWY